MRDRGRESRSGWIREGQRVQGGTVVRESAFDEQMILIPLT